MHVTICLQLDPRLQLCGRLEGEVGLCFAMVPIDIPDTFKKTFRDKKWGDGSSLKSLLSKQEDLNL